MTFWKALTTTYRGSIAFLIACPLLALVPVVFELVQHVVEVRIGLYDSVAAARATAAGRGHWRPLPCACSAGSSPFTRPSPPFSCSSCRAMRR